MEATVRSRRGHTTSNLYRIWRLASVEAWSENQRKKLTLKAQGGIPPTTYGPHLASPVRPFSVNPNDLMEVRTNDHERRESGVRGKPQTQNTIILDQLEFFNTRL